MPDVKGAEKVGSDRHLRIYDISDRELLHIIHEEADETTGWTDVYSISAKLGMEGARHIGVRLSWMGKARQAAPLVERDERQGHKHRWRLTRLGRNIMGGELEAQVMDALAGLDAGEAVAALRIITQRMKRMGHSRVYARREWQHGTQMRG